MEQTRCFLMQMKRAICSWRFCVACLCVGIVMYGNTYWYLTGGEESVISAWGALRGVGSFTMVLGLFPLLPYSLSYADERNQRILSFWVIRTGVKTYIWEKFFVSVISGMVAYILGMVLYACMACIQFPFFSGRISANDAYSGYLEQGKPFLYYALALIHYSFSAAFFCGVAVWISTCIPNRSVVLMLPVLVYLTIIRINDACSFLPMRPQSLVESITDAGSPLLSMLVKAGVTCLVLLLLGILTVEQAERRLKHE